MMLPLQSDVRSRLQRVLTTTLKLPPDEQPPPTHSHDEPPGASHHHGTGGTINPEPYHGHASDHGHH